MHFPTLFAASFVTLFTAPALATLQYWPAAYFNITNPGWGAYGQDETSEQLYVQATIYDPATSTGTNCTIKQLQPNVGFVFPAHWYHCEDTTFSMKIDHFFVDAMTLEFKHQYKEGTKGEPCLESYGPQCTTSRAAASWDSRVSPGVTSNDANLGVGQYYNVSLLAPVFSLCGHGCGLTTGRH